MSGELLPTVERDTRSPVGGAVIWMHGLGADGYDFEPIVPELDVDSTGLRFVLPHAPVRPVTINGGIPMRAWFDVISLDRGSTQDEEGIRDAERHIRALIRRENERGVPTDRILLAGFSQGGAVALHTGLRYPERLAGLIGLSTYLPMHWTLEGEADEANGATPVFMAHGSMDPLLPSALGVATRDLLRERGYPVEWHDYPMAHAVCAEEVGHLRVWLEGVLGR